MVGHLTNLDAPFRNQVAALQQSLATQSGQAAQSQAYGVIYQTLQQQAGLWAYVEQFRMLMPICLLLIPIIFLFKKAKGPAPVGAGGH
jgi:DHA2 family multidrug resistance protein